MDRGLLRFTVARYLLLDRACGVRLGVPSECSQEPEYSGRGFG